MHEAFAIQHWFDNVFLESCSVRFKFVVLLAGVGLLLSGCASGSIEGGWKSTKSFYYSHINTPANINYDDKGDLAEDESALSRRMNGMENQLRSLERVMLNSDRAPSPETVSAMLGRFPWLSGVLLLDVSGEVVAQQPMPMKTLDFKPMLELTGRGNDLRGLRGFVQDSPLGPEVALGIPVYRNAEMLGLFIAHFDMRALLRYGEEAGDLVIVSPDVPLWSGRYVFDSTPLSGQDWKSLSAGNSVGKVSNDNGEFLWLSRYIGAYPLIFSVPTSGTFQEDPEQLNMLNNQEPILAPVTDFNPLSGGPTILDSPMPAYMPRGGMSETPMTN